MEALVKYFLVKMLQGRKTKSSFQKKKKKIIIDHANCFSFSMDFRFTHVNKKKHKKFTLFRLRSFLEVCMIHSKNINSKFSTKQHGIFQFYFQHTITQREIIIKKKLINVQNGAIFYNSIHNRNTYIRNSIRTNQMFPNQFSRIE